MTIAINQNEEELEQCLFDALMELMRTMPLDKLTVNDILKQAHVSRSSFYRRYQDKYDLVNWIYSSETIPYMTSFSDKAHWADGMCDLCLYMQQNKKFYINALSTPGQNSFQEYLTDFLFDLILSLLDELCGERKVDQRDLDFIANFYSLAFVALVMQWAQHGMKEDPVEYVGRITALVDGNMLHELDKYSTKE